MSSFSFSRKELLCTDAIRKIRFFDGPRSLHRGEGIADILVYAAHVHERPWFQIRVAKLELTCLATFRFARILSTPLLKFFPAPLVLVAYGIMTSVFSLVAALTGGKTGMACLFLVFWGESVIYPTTFTLATSNLGIHTKRGAGLLCMGVAGGALFPPLQGLWADAKNTDISCELESVLRRLLEHS